MKTKEKGLSGQVAKKTTDEKPTKVSKTWLAMLASKGGEILDMRAVLK